MPQRRIWPMPRISSTSSSRVWLAAAPCATERHSDGFFSYLGDWPTALERVAVTGNDAAMPDQSAHALCDQSN